MFIVFLVEKNSTIEACNEYSTNMKSQLNNFDYIESHCLDLQNPVNSLMDWILASENINKSLDKKTNEPRLLLFFIGQCLSSRTIKKACFLILNHQL